MKKCIVFGVLFAIMCLFASCEEQAPSLSLPTASSTSPSITPSSTAKPGGPCANDHSFTEDSDCCSICGTNYYSATLEMELSYTGDYYIVTGLGRCTRAVIRIPEMHNNLPVSVIDEYAFSKNANSKCAEITEVVLPSTIKEIRTLAFHNCTSLQSIEFPQNLTDIGVGAFSYCASLESIVFGNQVSVIGDHAFAECVMLSEVSLPDSLTQIGEYAFSGCTRLSEVILPRSVSIIKEGAFYNCTALTAINVPVGTEEIGKDAFAGCAELQYNIYQGMAYLGDTENPYYALIDRDDASYKVADIHDDTQMIADNAFYGSDIVALIIGKNLKTFGWNVLLNLKDLSEMQISTDNLQYHITGNCLIETESKTLLKGCSTSVIPDDGSVTSIGKMAFAYVAGMTSIVIPDTIVSIEANAFIYCVDLEEMIIGSGVQFVDHDQLIGAEKFSRCYYRGNQNQWEMIDIVGITSGGAMGLNTKIKNATKYFYSEEPPTEPGNYWHYVDGVPTPWE